MAWKCGSHGLGETSPLALPRPGPGYLLELVVELELQGSASLFLGRCVGQVQDGRASVSPLSVRLRADRARIERAFICVIRAIFSPRTGAAARSSLLPASPG